MIEPELLQKLDEISAKADAAYKAAESVRKYMVWKGVITAILIVLPLVGLAFAIPTLLTNYTDLLSGLGY